MAKLLPLPLILHIFSLFFVPEVTSTSFTLVNKCDYTVWPGILSNAGVPPLPTTGFVLQKGETRMINAPSSWGGRFWGRTLCFTDSATGKFSCATGDCGSGKLECSGAGAAPPASLAEFTLDGSGGLDFYDVSLVDGYNLPMLVAPQGGSGDNCTSTGCIVDLNGSCPSELRVSSVGGGEKSPEAMACKSACEAFRRPEYCCSGAYASPDTCKPSSYSQIFKSACPRAYSYAYDDKTSTFTCAKSPDYVITFCPSPNTSQKSLQGQGTEPTGTSPATQTPTTTATWSPMDTSMIYEGAFDESGASSPSTCRLSISTRAGTLALLLAFCRVWRLF
ncbi:PREDICTED: thaumatin-like protein 1b [Tarenaya hassleriana]|uniref:thaumatin-like protein 1b n=1 Tax=Tarenaya hassleriana TaxID=28532 RepID=UPI00053C90B6|nr:PREDICTED: thaumatin-like protein 1b [Tarenaya hassleriana]